jgi:outer membrane protein assembly factor BamB
MATKGEKEPQGMHSGAPGWPGRTSDDKPYLLPAARGWAPMEKLKLEAAKNPLASGTLGDTGLAVRVKGAEEFAECILVQPVTLAKLAGLDPLTVRTFRYDERSRTLRPVWNSGINRGLGFIWARIQRAGLFVQLGLPRDRLLQELIRRMARERRLADPDLEKDTDQITRSVLKPFMELPAAALQELREYLTSVEIQTSIGGLSPIEVVMREGGHPQAFRLPGNATLDDFRRHLQELKTPPGGLPEEQLFFPPDIPRNWQPPWDVPPERMPWKGVDWRRMVKFDVWRLLDEDYLIQVLPWLISPDWWMYQHDIRHTGHASGLSDITSTTVHRMHLYKTVTLDGPVITKPSIVDGKVYIGSGLAGGSGGTLHKIDLTTGAIERTTPTSGSAFYTWVSGIGGSPAVTGGRVYFTGVHGTVYCVDANTFAPIWSVSLKAENAARNQPVNNPSADSWSGPLVVNGKVYVGCGEGESATTYGFIFCLNADTGNVLWCFCTCKFSAGGDNQPNHLPASVAAAWAAAAGFTVQPNPSQTGCAVWSSCAYDIVNRRIYVGTGNSQYPHTSEPDDLYGSGLMSLDADTGQFRGFFQPTADDSYWPGDSDIDVPGSPTVYSLGGQRVVAFGSKNGSFFVLDAGTLAPVARRQLLPRAGGTGLPGDRGAVIPAVVPTGGAGENSYGILGTPAIHSGLHRIFVGLGGYNGMNLDAEAGIDQTRTPFMRALNWDDLHDAWPTSTGADGVTRYTNTKPPMYTSLEVGLSSPAVVNDVVFVSTSPPPHLGGPANLYALSVNDGHCLWTAGGLPPGAASVIFALGPAIYGNFVVVGAGNTVFIYRLGPFWRFPWWAIYRKPWPWEIVEQPQINPGPPPPPEEILGPWIGPQVQPIEEKRVAPKQKT